MSTTLRIAALVLGLAVLAGCDFTGASGSPRVGILGDSIVHQAEGQIRTNLQPDHRVTVFAYNNAKIHQMRFAAKVQASQGAQAIVVALGAPDVVAAADPPPGGDPVPYLADLVRGIRNVPCVALVTVKEHGVAPIATQHWAEGARRLNAEMRRLARVHPNVMVVDWSEITEGHTDWFLGDGLHLTAPGVQSFALAIDGAADCNRVAGSPGAPGTG